MTSTEWENEYLILSSTLSIIGHFKIASMFFKLTSNTSFLTILKVCFDVSIDFNPVTVIILPTFPYRKINIGRHTSFSKFYLN